MAEKRDKPTIPDMKLIFGDWCFATLKGVIEDKAKGKVIFGFIPDANMIYEHQIQDEDYDEQYGVVKKEYDEEFCHCPKKDALSQTWILSCDYNNKPCDPIIGINHELTIKNKSLKAERDALDKAFTLFRLKNKKIISHPEEFKEEVIKEFKKQKVVTRDDMYDVEQKGKGGDKSE